MCQGLGASCAAAPSRSVGWNRWATSGRLFHRPRGSPGLLQLLESETAPVMAEAIARNVGTSVNADAFPNKARIATADGHASNQCGEDLFNAFRNHWPTFLHICELHKCAIVNRDAFNRNCVSCCRGILYTGLVLNYGEQMSVFRQCLYDEIVESLDILLGAPPPAAQAYRQTMLDLYFGSATVITKTLAQGLPNGDWRVKTRVQFYPWWPVADANEVDKQAIAHVFACALVKTFVNEAFVVHAPHHWVGFDRAVDQQGGLEACHSLARRTMKRFLGIKGSVGTGKVARSGLPLAVLDGAQAPVPLQDAPAPDQPLPGQVGEPAVDPQMANAELKIQHRFGSGQLQAEGGL